MQVETSSLLDERACVVAICEALCLSVVFKCACIKQCFRSLQWDSAGAPYVSILGY